MHISKLTAGKSLLHSTGCLGAVVHVFAAAPVAVSVAVAVAVGQDELDLITIEHQNRHQASGIRH